MDASERMAKTRAERKKAGLRRLEFWVYIDEIEEMKKQYAKLIKKRVAKKY